MWGFNGKITRAMVWCPFRGGFGALILFNFISFFFFFFVLGYKSDNMG